MTKVLEIALLGRAHLTQNGTPLADLVSAKARALLYYLAVTGRAHSRQALAGLLWGELPESDARRNLRVALLKLRGAVADHLIVSHQTLAFDFEAPYRLDVARFRHILEENRSPAPQALQEAVALYRGDFLQDFHVRQAPDFEAWVMGQRRRLREMVLDAYAALAEHYLEAGEYNAGIGPARQLLQLDPIREEGHRLLMQLLALEGRRGAALAQYEACRETLQGELGIDPAPETAVLRDQIRAGALKPPSAARPSPKQPPTTPAAPAAPPLPFIAGPPITDPRHFFGRRRELSRIFNLLQRPPLQNAAIIGPRRSGKTSLLHYLQTISTTPPERRRPDQTRQWLSQPEQYRWVFVDFQDARLGRREPLMRHLLTQMALTVPERLELDTFLDVVSEELTFPVVVLLDEIGVAMERYGELDDAFWDSMRSLATNQVNGRLAFILTAPHSPTQLADRQGLGSPFFNIFGYTARLGPLTPEEAEALVASAPRPFPEEDVAWILAESGRWPLLLQILCRERLFALEEGVAGPEWRDDALAQLRPFLALKETA